ncbi:hypothetical protein GCM10010172_02100 [Paractinoplanes ferrugineus]|uniref:Uncharacterized protein n=1 Tax=Paractinoplanes ferrugineus TaxID=113564 RepID=A0A919MNA2_9ACTN|nr:hypothetical protein [Actinoplanes ferrugineus]GIE14057.1 hypothetical protein Afe05nite_58970 [Actinoplanes ferrugineus]
MSPVSRGRKKAKSSRIIRRVPDPATAVPDVCDCPACRAGSDPEALAADLAVTGADLLAVEDPLTVEMLGSSLVASVDVGGEGLVEALSEGLIPAVAATSTPESLAVLLAIAAVENRATAGAEAQRLREAGVPDPGWVEALSDPVKPEILRLYREPTGESAVLLGTFARAGQSHGFVIGISHLDCDAATDILMFPGESLEQAEQLVVEDGQRSGITFTAEDMEPADFRWQADRALTARAVHDWEDSVPDTGDGFDENGQPDYYTSAVLLRARLRVLPEPTRPPAPHGSSAGPA